MMFLISFTIHSAAIGAKVTGVDETTFTRSGKAFSTVFMPRESSHNHRVLQKDNVEVAYDFASRYPVRVAFKLSNSNAKAVTIPLPHHFDCLVSLSAFAILSETYCRASLYSCPVHATFIAMDIFFLDSSDRNLSGVSYASSSLSNAHPPAALSVALLAALPCFCSSEPIRTLAHHHFRCYIPY